MDEEVGNQDIGIADVDEECNWSCRISETGRLRFDSFLTHKAHTNQIVGIAGPIEESAVHNRGMMARGFWGNIIMGSQGNWSGFTSGVPIQVGVRWIGTHADPQYALPGYGTATHVGCRLLGIRDM
jgi:hypothetical protein